MDLPENLLELERAAWTELREDRLTVETSASVQAAITAHAEAEGLNRYELEAALKNDVRHPEE